MRFNAQITKWLAPLAWITALALFFGIVPWSDFAIDDSGLNKIARPVNAQDASQTTFYFKNDTATANAYWGVAGPTVDNSSDTVEVTCTGATTAIAMHPIAGPVVAATTSDSQSCTSVGDSNADLAWYRTFVMPLASGMQFTSSTTFTVGASFDESNAAANAFPRAFVYVYDSGSNSNVKTLAGPTTGGTEAGTTDQGRIWTVTNGVGGTPYTTDNTDYLAVEIWIDFQHTTTTAYTCTLRWGGNTVVAENTSNTTPASYIQIGGTTVDTFDPLYLLPTNTDRQAKPDEQQGGETFRTSTLDARRLSTTPGSGAETNSQTVEITGNPYYYRMNIWCSPPLAAQTIPAGNWIIHFHGDEASTSNNAWARYMIYTWDADDTIGDTIYGPTDAGLEFTASTTNNQREDVAAGSAATITAGERLCFDAKLVSKAATVASAGNFRFGSATAPTTSTYDSAILPPMNYSSSPAPLTYQTEQYEQTHFKFDEDNDGETHAGGWTDANGAIAEDAGGTYPEDTNFRLRVQWRNNGGVTDPVTPLLYYRDKAGGSWTLVTNSSTDVFMSLSSQFTDNTATTRQLTDLSSSGWTFQAGRMKEDSAGVSIPGSMGAWDFTEWEWSLQAANPATYEFKVTDSGTDFTTYTVTPSAIITAAASLSINSEATAVTLNAGAPGETTTDYTFSGTEEVLVDSTGYASWTLSVSATNFSSGGDTISNTKFDVGTNGDVGTAPTVSLTTGSGSFSEPNNGYLDLSSSRTLLSLTGGSGTIAGRTTPTLRVRIPATAVPHSDYVSTITFTVI